MRLETISTNPSSYVVLDVETNGLKSKECDLLSISFYKPDDRKEFNRFLPLDLNRTIPPKITAINGIKAETIKNEQHLTQEEVNELISVFELDKRTILHYGSLDRRFIRDYFARHGLSGFDQMTFFNFKQLICPLSWSDGSITKDNLCKLFRIQGVNAVHTGLNDCKLEWELFKAIDGHFLLARMEWFKWNISVLSPDYILPVSYLSNCPNLSRAFPRPYICAAATSIFSLSVSGPLIRHFQSNGSGITIENLINVLTNGFNAKTCG